MILRKIKKAAKIALSFPSYIQQRNNIILVYTMGKVGSSTMYNTLKKHLPFTDIFHVHFLSTNWLEKILPEKPQMFHRNINKGMHVLNHLSDNEQKRIKIISLVRDPFGRVVSDLFENWEAYFPNKPPNETKNDEILEKLKTSNLDYVLNWFETEFKNFTNFDVYHTPFDYQRGYTIYQNQDFDFICFQLEKLNSCYNSALKEFLKIDVPELLNANVTRNKNTGDLAGQIKQLYTPQEELLSHVYSSKFMTHFYSPTQIKNFKNRWLSQ